MGTWGVRASSVKAKRPGVLAHVLALPTPSHDAYVTPASPTPPPRLSQPPPSATHPNTASANLLTASPRYPNLPAGDHPDLPLLATPRPTSPPWPLPPHAPLRPQATAPAQCDESTPAAVSPCDECCRCCCSDCKCGGAIPDCRTSVPLGPTSLPAAVSAPAAAFLAAWLAPLWGLAAPRARRTQRSCASLCSRSGSSSHSAARRASSRSARVWHAPSM